MWWTKSCLLILLALLLATDFADAVVGFACTAGSCDAANNEVCDLVDTVRCLCGAGYADNAGSCDPVDCGTAPTLTNGSRTDGGGTVYTDQATFGCNTGYTLANTATIQCWSNGQWDALAATCTIVDCGTVPAAPTNGAAFSNTGTTYQQTATYTCNSGYAFSGGASGTISCQASGSWETVPTCAVDCGSVPAAPSNGAAASNTGTTYQQTATYTCNSGYAFSGGVSGTLSCLVSGLWETVPTCSAVDCGAVPNLNNGARSDGGTTTFGSTATYACNPGYDISGVLSIDCQTDGSWEAVGETCTAEDSIVAIVAGVGGALVVILIVVIVVVICCYRKLLAMVKEMSDQPYREGRFPEPSGRQGNIHSTNNQADDNQGGSSQISMTILDHQNQNMFSNVRADSPRNNQSPPHPIITNNGQIGGQGNNPLHGHVNTGLAETELTTPQSQYEYIDDYVMGDVTVSEDNYIHAE